MRSVIAHIGARLVPPRHLLATVLARCAMAALCHAAVPHLPEPLASFTGFVAHVALLMAIFGLLAHLEAIVIGHALRAADNAQPHLKAAAKLARSRFLGRGAKLSMARMRGIGEASTLTSAQP